jgi:hypothetical protein
VFLSVTNDADTLTIIISTATKPTEELNTGLFSLHIGLSYPVFNLLIGHVVVEKVIVKVRTTF